MAENVHIELENNQIMSHFSINLLIILMNY